MAVRLEPVTEKAVGVDAVPGTVETGVGVPVAEIVGERAVTVLGAVGT